MRIFLDIRDIHEVKENEVPESDVIVGGFPCQAFSIVDIEKDLRMKEEICFELLRIIKEREPRAIFIENVKTWLLMMKEILLELLEKL